MDYKRILSLHFTNGMSGREIAAVTGDGKTTVNEFLKRFRECEQFSYPLSENVTNEFIAESYTEKPEKARNPSCIGTLTQRRSIVRLPAREKP